MKARNILAALLLMVTGLQTADAQGFRVYLSDGTELQFSLKTDSIVFDNGLNGDKVFGPFTPVNQCIVGTWYMSNYETLTFREDGTTNYMDDVTYEFMPYQGNIIFNNASGMPMNILRVYKLTDEMLVVSMLGDSSFTVLTRTKPQLLVTSITLSETFLVLQPDETKRLTTTVMPEDADNPDVKWESSDESVAEVNQNGRVTANALGTCTITCSATDGSGVKAECQVSVKQLDTMEYVDLGLPSGTLWATCNIGASSPEDYGDYFAWGETQPKDEYTWSNYKYCKGSYNTMTRYCFQSDYGYNGFTDTLTELLPEDDAATANLGNDWQMPSIDQIMELYNSEYTTTTWTTQNGKNGKLVTSKSNGKSIFLPAAGYRNNTSLNNTGNNGYYWSRSLPPNYSIYAYGPTFSSDNILWATSSRCSGYVVRPVRVLE